MLFKEFYRLKSLERYDKIYPLIHIINEDNKLVFEKLKKIIYAVDFHLYFIAIMKEIKLIINDVNVLMENGNLI